VEGSSLESTQNFFCPNTIDPNDSYGPGFQCPFLNILSHENEILFITGDKQVWAIASYEEFLALPAQDPTANLDFRRCLEKTIASVGGHVFIENCDGNPRVSIYDGNIKDMLQANKNLIVWGLGIDEDRELKNYHTGMNVYIRPKRTALEDDWRVGPFSVIDQTLSLKYGSIGEDISERDIEFYARGPPATGEENIDVNCFSQGGAWRGSLQRVNDHPAGYSIVTFVSPYCETLLAITFKSYIESSAGYNKGTSNAPTVEFCVNVTVGGKIYRQLAVKYTFNLNGAFKMDSTKMARRRKS
jgi:hypothetical protein